MMSDTNSKGLKRDIPDGIKREVRQRDGFGCVLCGNAIFEYEHYDPPFNEADEHKPSGITLLCSQCHSKKTRGILSLKTIKAAVSKPRCKQKGFSFEAFDVGSRPPYISLGTLHFQNVGVLIRVLGDNILSISPPEVLGGPFLISALITDINGKRIFEISENEWKISLTNWDAEVVGRRIIIRKANRDIALIIRSDPPDSLTIERINMMHKGTTISGQEGMDIMIRSPQGNTMTTQGATFIGCQIGVDVTPFSLRVGVGGGSVLIDSMVIGPDPRLSNNFLNSSPPKISRNSPCWCGSQLKFKKCHGKLALSQT